MWAIKVRINRPLLTTKPFYTRGGAAEMAEIQARSPFNLPVTIATVDGAVQSGKITQFSPELPDLILEEQPAAGARSTKVNRIHITTERIIYVAFHKQQAPRFFEEMPEKPARLKIHVSGGLVIAVSTDPAKIDNILGFYARPLDSTGPFQEMYFYAAAVNAKESTEPLGAMLLANGTLAANELDAGLANLDNQRKVPIGQILVEYRKVSRKDIEEACQLQERTRLRLGEILVEQGLATDDDIQKALGEQKKRRGKRLGEVLVEMGVIQEAALFQTLAKKFHMPFVDLDEIEIGPNVLSAVSREIIEKYRILPLGLDATTLTVAISDPLRTEVHDVLRFSSKTRIQEVVATPSQLNRYVDNLLKQGEDSKEVDGILKMLEAESTTLAEQVTPEAETVLKETDSAVVKLSSQIIIDAYRRGASDIHIEPNGPKQNMLIRFRVDGSCAVYQAIPAAFRFSLVARLKVMAQLDISERRKPQDGKIKFRISDDKEIELRVATLPTSAGNEDVVMRILAGSKPLPLDKMGMSERNLREFTSVLAKPYGLVLCVGPTGSGKTTTLHSGLGHINRTETKIWTAEDPVEITQPGLRQVQVNSKIGLTFAAAMRAFLRADPDVIMIGEMRDHETASTAIEASLTGHLVFSTLHTNNAPETVVRLLDMGLDPFTFADSLLGVLAQRLVRSICIHCRERYTADENEIRQVLLAFSEEELKKRLGIAKPENLELWRSSGCRECGGQGTKGRVAIHELLISTDEIKHCIQRKASASEIRDIAVRNGMTTLLQDGIEKSISGKTTLSQVAAVCSI
jgi:type II secretory ATPase GspE/PulE/Tfp pilus assembly ATPase PilB-like protein